MTNQVDFDFDKKDSLETFDLGNTSIDEYIEQERHFAESTYLKPQNESLQPNFADRVQDTAKNFFLGSESVDNNGDYLPISSEEITARAKTETIQIVSYIETGTKFINGLLILRKGDNMTFEDYEEQKLILEADKKTFVVEPDSELSKVIERMGKYKKTLQTCLVTEDERKIIMDAIVADLKKQNKAKQLKAWSKWEAVAHIGSAKILPNIQEKAVDVLQGLIAKF